MKITSVDPQKNTPRRFNIFLDGEFAFGAGEDLVVNRRLVVGKEINLEDLDKILFEAEVGKMMERMYRWFGIRQRSEKEAREYLRNLSFKRKIKEKDEISQIVVDSIVDKLKKKGILDDVQFARAWTESRLRKYGPQRIKAELFQKGIGREIIEEVISLQSTVDREKEVAVKLLAKKVEVWRNLPSLVFKKKAYDFLLRRGFGYSQVKDIVANFIEKR